MSKPLSPKRGRAVLLAMGVRAGHQGDPSDNVHGQGSVPRLHVLMQLLAVCDVVSGIWSDSVAVGGGRMTDHPADDGDPDPRSACPPHVSIFPGPGVDR